MTSRDSVPCKVEFPWSRQYLQWDLLRKPNVYSFDSESLSTLRWVTVVSVSHCPDPGTVPQTKVQVHIYREEIEGPRTLSYRFRNDEFDSGYLLITVVADPQ